MKRRHNKLFNDVCFGLFALLLCCFGVQWLPSKPVRSIEFWFGIYFLAWTAVAISAYVAEYRKERRLVAMGLVTHGLVVEIKKGIRNNRSLRFVYPDPHGVMHVASCEYINKADQPGQSLAVMLNRNNYNEAHPLTQFRFFRPVI
jgi:apolipoprotein N-acyltransferase